MKFVDSSVMCSFARGALVNITPTVTESSAMFYHISLPGCPARCISPASDVFIKRVTRIEASTKAARKAACMLSPPPANVTIHPNVYCLLDPGRLPNAGRGSVTRIICEPVLSALFYLLSVDYMDDGIQKPVTS